MINLYDNPSTAQWVISPYYESYPSANKTSIEYDNCSYLLSAGNDMIIRYWDIAREGINNNEKKIFIVNAPNNSTHFNFTKSNFDKTNIIMESFYFKTMLMKMISDFFRELLIVHIIELLLISYLCCLMKNQI